MPTALASDPDHDATEARVRTPGPLGRLTRTAAGVLGAIDVVALVSVFVQGTKKER